SRLVDPVAGRRLARRLAAPQSSLDRRSEALGLLPLSLLTAVGELRDHPLGEQLERLADVLVAVAARLEHESDLVDADRLVAAHEVGYLVGRADRAAKRPEPVLHDLHTERRLVGGDDLAREALVVAAGEELLPDVGPAGQVRRDAVVVRERVAEEV